MAVIEIRSPSRLYWYGWKPPLPSYVRADEKLWMFWRQEFLQEIDKRPETDR